MGEQWGRTLAHDPDWLRQRAEDAPYGPLPTITRVTSPCCGRLVPADTIADLRSVPGTVFRAPRHRAVIDHDAACDGCRWILHATTAWTPSRLARAMGAPHSVVRHLRAVEMRDEAVRAAHADGRGADPTAEYDNAHGGLPVGVVDLPGTEPPPVPR